MKRLMVFLLFITLLVCAVWFSASAETTMVEYVDAYGVPQAAVEATIVESSIETVTWNTGWYAVEGSVQISTRIEIAGDVNVILADNAVFSAPRGIHVTGSNSLTIWGQSAGNGELTIDNVDYNYAGIGGNTNQSNGPIIINGGTIQARGSDYGGAGIGGGNSGAGRDITINGGTVTAIGGDHIEGSAGIGGGRSGDGINITINGGTIIANGSGSRYGGAGIGGGCDGDGTNITINGGTIQAKGKLAYTDGAGIGGGYSGDGSYITITGGTVTANGIGGGCYGDGSHITITGGTIEATGRSEKDLITTSRYYTSAGIGGGHGGDGSNITITGGTVTATGGSANASATYTNTGASGIGGGGGGGNGKNITISGGTVIASGGSSSCSGAGIGGGGFGSGSEITISGGMVTAYGMGSGMGIGGGKEGSSGSIMISGGTIVAKGGSAIGTVPTFDSYDHLTFGNAEATTETDTPVEWTGYPNEEWSWRWVKIQPATITLIFDPTNPTVVLDGISSSTLNFTVEYSAILPDGANALLPEAAPTWSVSGNQSSDTTIASGKLTVAADERAATLTVTASLNGTTYTTQVTVQQPTYTVTFDSGVSAQTVSRYKQAIEPTPPSRAGYIFAGWYNNGVLYDFTREVIGNLTLIARWTEDPASSEDITPPSVAPDATHVITLDPNGGSCHLSSLTTTSDGTLPPLPTAARKGYTFDGWFTKREGGERVMSTTVFTSDTTVYAHWIEIPKTGDETPLALWALLIVLALGGMLFSLQRPIKHR